MISIYSEYNKQVFTSEYDKQVFTSEYDKYLQ